MIGVSADEMEKLAKDLESELDEANAKLSILKDQIDTLKDIFKQNQMKSVSENLKKLYNGQVTIIKSLSSYIDVLNQVSLSYRKQEEQVSETLNSVTKN